MSRSGSGLILRTSRAPNTFADIPALKITQLFLPRLTCGAFDAAECKAAFLQLAVFVESFHGSSYIT